METSRTQLAKWGNSLAVRIPTVIAEGARLREGDQLTLAVAKNGAVVIRPARRRYKIEQLVSAITTKNRHPETSWGRPAGKEVW